MDYVKLDRTGLEVSRICLGCMSYGSADSGNHTWSLGEEEARPFIKRALEAASISSTPRTVIRSAAATRSLAGRSATSRTATRS